MAKNFKKLMAMVLAVCMTMTMLAMPAFAAEEDDTNYIDGVPTNVTSNTTTDTDANGNKVETTVKTETANGTNESNQTIVFSETTTTQTTTDANGNVIKTQESGEGSKTVTGTGEVTSEDKDLTKITVELKEGQTTTNTDPATNESTETNTTAPDDGREYTDYSETTKTTIDRTVTATTGEMKIDPSSSEYDGKDIDLIKPVGPESYDGKQYDNKETLKVLEGLINGQGKDCYLKDEEAALNERPDVAGYDYLYSGQGDATNAVKVRSEEIIYLRHSETGEIKTDAEGNYIIVLEYQYKKNADGTLVLDENGNRIRLIGEDGYYLTNKTTTDINHPELLSGGNNDGYDKSTTQFALKQYDANGKATGNYFYAYCIDNNTPTNSGKWYRITNLEDCDYFPDEESADYLRAIVNNGYWGSESGTGSLTEIKENLKAYYKDKGFVATYNDKGNTKTYTAEEFEAIIDGLTESEALAVTQAVIWSFANGTVEDKENNGEDNRLVQDIVPVEQPRNGDPKSSLRYYRIGAYTGKYTEETKDSNARIQALYEMLMNLEPEKSTTATTIFNEKHFLTEDGMKLTIGDKVADATEDTNAMYSAELSFTMVVVPSDEKDDLIVKLVNADGDVIAQGRIAGNGENDGDDYVDLVKDEKTNTYTFTDLKLEEDTDITFNLKLEGTQYIEKGVYVYSAPEYSDYQTLVGIAEGNQHVGVSATMNFKFSVDEKKTYKTEAFWTWENDPQEEPQNPNPPYNPPVNPPVDDPYTEIPEPEVPLEEIPEETPLDTPEEELEEIPEDIPMAEVPKTGDESGMWTVMMILAAISLLGLAMTGRKSIRA